MKRIIFSITVMLLSIHGFAQDSEKEKPQKEKGFKKENLFTGGSVSLGFSGNSFLIGGSPVFGYSVAKWVDAGLVANYNYSSFRDYAYFNDKLHQSVYGGGAFLKLYPVRFLFVQAQAEHNFINLKYFPPGSSSSVSSKADPNSLLLGAGYTTGRYPGRPFFYLAVLVDVVGNINSPYVDGNGRKIPIIRGGIQVPLFQRK
jgi:hypothetical protein